MDHLKAVPAEEAYEVLDAGRVIAALDESPIGERPASESVARELVPVLRDDTQRPSPLALRLWVHPTFGRCSAAMLRVLLGRERSQ